jgi:hypothetical protein
MSELDDILSRLDNQEPPIDELAEDVKRGDFLFEMATHYKR